MTVPIKDIRTCEPAMWKAISCALNVKPCNAQGSHGRICKWVRGNIAINLKSFIASLHSLAYKPIEFYDLITLMCGVGMHRTLSCMKVAIQKYFNNICYFFACIYKILCVNMSALSRFLGIIFVCFRADCISVLDKCVDNSERSYNTGALCDQLLVSDDEKECISLLQFIGKCLFSYCFRIL